VDFSFVMAFINIMIIDLILSGDNAVVVGMAARNLPPRQRKKAVLYGTLGAVVLRISFTGIALWLLMIPYIKLIGGVLLLWIALKLLIQEEQEASIGSGQNVWDAVKIIIIADVIMSLDNVLAIGGAAKGDLYLVIFGLMLSIPLLMWGSTMVAKWMNDYPVLVYFGSGVLAFTAGTMILEDPAAHLVRWTFAYAGIMFPLLLTGLVLLFGKAWRSRIFTIHHIK
jgi:YjbE family integral membrane protein